MFLTAQVAGCYSLVLARFWARPTYEPSPVQPGALE